MAGLQTPTSISDDGTLNDDVDDEIDTRPDVDKKRARELID
jgi:hypothetical protein